MNPLSKFFPRLFGLVRHHIVLTGVLVTLCIALGAFGAFIGFIQIVVLLVPIAVIAWVIIARRLGTSGVTGGRAEAIVVCASIAVATVVTLAGIQLVPYGKSTTNPSNFERAFEPDWDSPATRELVVNACYGCHSNEVKYPSYSKIAPISWMVQSHIDEGRDELNFSLAKKSKDYAEIGEESIETIEEGSMPPGYYTRFGLHPEAKLTAEQKNQLIKGLMATFGVTANSGDRERGDED